MKASQHADHEFIAKFMCAVDHRLYQWLLQCCTKSSVEETTLHLLDYSTLFEDIIMNRFQYILPLAIIRVRKPPPPPLDSTPAGGDRDRKKPKRAEQVKNENPVEEWKLRQGERWDLVFRSKSGEAPMLSMGCKLCLKFWVKGLCYTDCKNRASHVQTLSEEDRSLAMAYITELRGE